MRKLVLFLGLFYYIFFSTKNYSSENKDNFELKIIDYKENIPFDPETIEKLKCDFHFSSITDIQNLKSNFQDLKSNFKGPHHGNPCITIVLIKVTNDEEVGNFRNDFMKFFKGLIDPNKAPKEEGNTEINNPLFIRKLFYFVFIDKDDINYNKLQKGMNNENILEEFARDVCTYPDFYPFIFIFTFYKPIKNSDLGNAIYSICKSIYPEKYVSKNCCCDCCDICNIM